MSESLPALVAHASELIQRILENDGEITEFIESEMQVSSAALAQKTDSYKIVLEQLKLQNEYWKAKSREAQKVAQAMAAVSDSLKYNIKNAMNELDIKELKGNDYRFKASVLKPKLELNEEMLPKEYMIEEVKFVPDKDRIRRALETGKQIIGARLIESTGLRAYVNKG